MFIVLGQFLCVFMTVRTCIKKIAKTPERHQSLTEAVQMHSVFKQYLLQEPSRSYFKLGINSWNSDAAQDFIIIYTLPAAVGTI